MLHAVLLHLLGLLLQCWCIRGGPPCNITTVQRFNVSNAAEALVLSNATLCEGGAFAALWSGLVQLPRTILVGSNTTLNVIGVGGAAEAVIDGSDSVQLFDVENTGALHLAAITLKRGFAEDLRTGGAVSLMFESTFTAVDVQVS
jgi:hypothetical protein